MLISATTVIKAKNGVANVHFPCEVKADSIEEVYARLIENGAILADRLETRVVGGHREVIGRATVVIGLAGVVLLQPLHYHLKEQVASSG